MSWKIVVLTLIVALGAFGAGYLWLEKVHANTIKITMACGGIGNSVGPLAPFERVYEGAMDGNRVTLNRGTAGKEGFEEWKGDASTESFLITGSYIEVGAKTLSFKATKTNTGFQADGQRGPRKCHIDAIRRGSV